MQQVLTMERRGSGCGFNFYFWGGAISGREQESEEQEEKRRVQVRYVGIVKGDAGAAGVSG